MNKELDHCPFCGGEVEIIELPTWGYTEYGILCKNKKCKAMMGYFKTKQELVNAWNTRVKE